MKQSALASCIFFGIGCAMAWSALLAPSYAQAASLERPAARVLERGETQLFVDSVMIREKQGMRRVIHPARKLAEPVLRAEMPWESKARNGVTDRRLNI